MLQVMLAEHNAERRALGIPEMQLDDDLNDQAQAYAEEMARTGNFAHSSSSSRPNQGENLWAGTASRFEYDAMVGGWIGEKQYYIHDRFPYVSNTGNWQDVGHYTQIIWRDTTRLGCGLATGGGWDYLVCRYSPPGNIVGQYAY
uniref:CAP domain-containing protein n=1 Tax=uncultured Altererythrobacter sp. TaxID=500840 RepID=UPI0026142E35|nr:CAP domain-containing protein [uncultured Altererythrobacter sp.]